MNQHSTPQSIEILYDAQGLIAVNKPPGLPSTGRTLEDPDCLQFQLCRHLHHQVWAVHQLDRETSGINLFVTRKSLVHVWQERLQAGACRKEYLAICHGQLDFSEHHIDLPISGERLPTGEWQWQVSATGRRAESWVQVMDATAQFALVRVLIATGRTHQIRIHMAHIGHPLVGEKRYRVPACTLHPRHALHAAWLRLDPGGPFAEISAPLAPDLVELASRLGLKP